MKTLPNGVTIFNSTPHPIRFWSEDWDEPMEVETDLLISAAVAEVVDRETRKITFVQSMFLQTDEGEANLAQMWYQGSENGGEFVIVGSIIAAQAYPGAVVAMVPCAGYERVPPAEKRVRPDKFTVFPGGH